MANVALIISYANTFGDWVVLSNSLAKENNDLAANNYVKPTGTLYLNNPSLGLQVANNAVVAGSLSVQGIGSSSYVQNTFRVDGLASFTNTSMSLISYGPATVNGILYATATGTGLSVSNNATIGKSLIVANTITANSISSNTPFAISTGGTGATSKTDALINLLPIATANNQYLTVISSNTFYWATPYANTITFTANTVISSSANTVQSAIDGLVGIVALKANATFSGIVTSPTPAPNTSNTQVATTAFVLGQLNNGNTYVHSVSGTANNITAYSINQNLANTSNVQFASIGVGTAPDSANTGSIRAINNITAYYSDDRLKTKLGNIENALDKVMNLNGFYYEANQTAQDLGYKITREVGLSAQEVQKELPEVIAPAPIDPMYMTIHYERVIPLLVEAIKELKYEINSLKSN
jgi:hypothetical protein